jgi:hypothetical protein
MEETRIRMLENRGRIAYHLATFRYCALWLDQLHWFGPRGETGCWQEVRAGSSSRHEKGVSKEEREPQEKRPWLVNTGGSNQK